MRARMSKDINIGYVKSQTFGDDDDAEDISPDIKSKTHLVRLI
jgi:hypothetical protein